MIYKLQKGKIIPKITEILKAIKPPKVTPKYTPVKRSGLDSPVRSAPIMDITRYQLPSFKTGSLGRGNYYRVIGNNSGLNDVINNGIRGGRQVTRDYDEVY